MGGAAVKLIVKDIRLDDGARILRGIASTADVDRRGDVLEPLGCVAACPLPLLAGHDHREVIGRVIRVDPSATGVRFEAEIPRISEPGQLRDRVELAWQELRAGLLSSVSVGFRSLSREPLKGGKGGSGGTRFRQWELLELSITPVPANPAARITAIHGKEVAAPVRAPAPSSPDAAERMDILVDALRRSGAPEHFRAQAVEAALHADSVEELRYALNRILGGAAW